MHVHLQLCYCWALYYTALRSLCGVESILAKLSRIISFCAKRSFGGLRRLKTYLRSTMWQQSVSSIAFINIEREYVNTIINDDIDRTTDFFGRRSGGDSYLF